MSTADIVGIVAGFLLFLLTMLTGLIAWIFLDFRAQTAAHRAEMTEQIKTNGRHLDGMMSSVWGLTWKVDAVEDFLERRMEYHPVRPPIPPGHTDDPR